MVGNNASAGAGGLFWSDALRRAMAVFVTLAMLLQNLMFGGVSPSFASENQGGESTLAGQASDQNTDDASAEGEEEATTEDELAAQADDQTDVGTTLTYATLKVQKQVDGDYTGDEEFSFVLEGVDGAPMPEDATAQVKAGNTASFGVIAFEAPADGIYYYTITEKEPAEADQTPGMTYNTDSVWVAVPVQGDDPVRYGTKDDVTGGGGTEAVDATVIVTNAYEAPANEGATSKAPGTIVVKKVVDSPRASDRQKDFGFRVSLYEDAERTQAGDFSGTYGDLEFANGVAEFTLRDGESKTVANLPTDEDDLWYEVQEIDAGGLERSSSKEESGDGATHTWTFTNTYVFNAEGTINVAKEVVGDAYDGEDDFTFELAAIDGAPLPESTSVTIRNNTAAGFGTITYTESGTYFYTIFEQVPEEAPLGMSYATDPVWARVDVDDALATTVQYGTEEAVRAGTAEHAAAAVVQNRYTNIGSIAVREVVDSSRSADKSRDYAFRITLYDDDERTQVKDLTGTYGDLEFTNGVAEFSLRDGESQTVANLPLGQTGVAYEVEETDDGGLTTSWNKEMSDDNASVTITCTNTYTSSSQNAVAKGKTSVAKTSTAKATTPATGDPTNMAILAVLALVGIGGIVFGLIRRKKQ